MIPFSLRPSGWLEILRKKRVELFTQTKKKRGTKKPKKTEIEKLLLMMTEEQKKAAGF